MDWSNELRTELAHTIGMATREVVDIERTDGGFMVTLHAGPPVLVAHPAGDVPDSETMRVEAEPVAPPKTAAKARSAARRKS